MTTSFGLHRISSLPSNLHCIYKITSPSGKVYIGQSINLRKRLIQYKNLHCKGQNHLLHSLTKYGAELHVVEIVHLLPFDAGKEVLDRYEMLYIEAYKSCGFALMNATDGGHGLKRRMPEETKKKLTGRKLSAETKAKISASLRANGPTGRTVSKEIRERLREKYKGIPRPDSVKEKIKLVLKINGNGWNGRKHTEETRKRISQSHLGKKQSDQHKAKAIQNRRNFTQSEESRKKISESLRKHYGKTG